MISRELMLLALSVPLVGTFALAQSPGTGLLTGAVTDPQGLPLVGAQVRYRSISPSVAAGLRATPPPSETMTSGLVSTDANGEFTISDLPPATYTLCAGTPNDRYLDSCVWGQGAGVSVAAGTTSSQTIVLQKGVYLKVRVNDPMHLLPQAVDGIWTPRKLVVGVWYGAGAYQGAPNISVDSTGRDYQLTIPAGTPFSLWLFSRDLALADSSGPSAIAATNGGAGTSGIPFQATTGQDQSFTFSVSGPMTSAAQ